MSHCRPRYREKGDRQYGHGSRLPPRAPNYAAKYSESYGLPPRVPSYTDSWQSLPTWEKSFWGKVSGMSWESFVEAKAYVDKTHKVYDWNDSAGKKALDDAKQRCWAEFLGLPCKKLDLQNADLYIDLIDWSTPEISSDSRVEADYRAHIKVPRNKKKAKNLASSTTLI